MLQKFIQMGSFTLIAYGFYFGWMALTEFRPLAEVVFALD
jgi:hypothetical protein